MADTIIYDTSVAFIITVCTLFVLLILVILWRSR